MESVTLDCAELRRFLTATDYRRGHRGRRGNRSVTVRIAGILRRFLEVQLDVLRLLFESLKVARKPSYVLFDFLGHLHKFLAALLEFLQVLPRSLRPLFEYAGVLFDSL
jgi:hypothetical protein